MKPLIKPLAIKPLVLKAVLLAAAITSMATMIDTANAAAEATLVESATQEDTKE